MENAIRAEREVVYVGQNKYIVMKLVEKRPNRKR